MKRTLLLTVIAVSVLVFAHCSGAKKTAEAAVVKSTYQSDMVLLVSAHCAPCHIPAKGGNKRAYDNYANVKTDIDEIIRRIELNPTDRGFMPFKKTAKLSDSTIAAFKKWKADGMLEN
jgi:mono/diheme cytochrome c family protein